MELCSKLFLGGLKFSCPYISTTRFLKSRENGFNIEDIRVLKYEGLKKMLVFVTFAYGFLCLLHQTQRKKVKKVILQNTKSFKPLPRFHFYRTIESTQRVFEKEFSHYT